MIVKVYRNLKHGRKSRPLYSIMHNGRVIARRHRVLLTSCKFVVNEAGRQRVIREGRKNVHAFVVGKWCRSKCGCSAFGTDDTDKRQLGLKIVYNPYRMKTFEIEGSCHPVKGAWGVLLNENGISATYID
jgi:hypothetical protein